MKRTASLLVMLAGLLLAPLHAIAAETQAPVIIAFGDSLTAGLGLPQDQSFPAQLEAALKARGTAATVINAGVSGDTAAAGLARLDWALPDNASAVIVELGANDALQGLPPEGTKQALAKIIETVQARGLPDPARRHGSPAQYGQGLRGPVPRDLCRSRRALSPHPLSVLSGGRRAARRVDARRRNAPQRQGRRGHCREHSAQGRRAAGRGRGEKIRSRFVKRTKLSARLRAPSARGRAAP